MTDTKDLREEILKDGDLLFYLRTCELLPEVKNAMDEYFERRAMELLEYMGKRNVECFSNPDGEGVMFLDKKIRDGYLTKEELFQNFL